MAKLLIAVMTCHRLDYHINDLTVDYATQKGWRCLDQQARVNTIRDTWLVHAREIDHKFFYGRQTPPPRGLVAAIRQPLTDEVFLDCGDKYTANPEKMKAICAYALRHGYDFVLRVDDDTYIYPERLLATSWAEHDYSGSSSKDFHPGGCMFLSRRAMQEIVSARITNWADDVWIGQVMADARIPMNLIPTIHNKWGDDYKVVPSKLPVDQLAAFHSCTPDVMRDLHQRGINASCPLIVNSEGSL